MAPGLSLRTIKMIIIIVIEDRNQKGDVFLPLSSCRIDQQEALGPEAPGAGGLWLAEGRAPACGLVPGYLCVPLALCSNKPTWPLTRRDYQEELCLVQRREAGLG